MNSVGRFLGDFTGKLWMQVTCADA
jgi:hypothetical protein